MASKTNEMPEVSDEVFAMVARELAGGKTDEALWTKAFAMQNGNESATKAHYIRLRVEQIQRGPDGRKTAEAKSTEVDSPQTAGPWARYFARYLDLALGVCLALFLVMLLLATIQPANVKMPGPAWVVISLLVICLIGLLPWVIDALMVAMFGNSLGKAIWGITVRHKDGRPLTFKETFNRNILVCLHGFWIGTTPLTFLPHIFSYKRLKKGEKTKWDAKGDFEVLSTNPGALRKIIGIALLIVALLMVALMDFGTKMVANNAFKTESAEPNQTNPPLSKKSSEPDLSYDPNWKPTSPPLSEKPSNLVPFTGKLDHPTSPPLPEKSNSVLDTKVLKIGVAGPMSGPQAHLGRDIANGVKLAVNEINSRGMTINGQRIYFQMIVVDDQADPIEALRSAVKLVDSGVFAVVGHMNSGASIPAAKIYAEAGIIQITPSATNPRLTQLGYLAVFRGIANDIQQAKSLAKFAVDQNSQRIAVIDDRTAYGGPLADEFVASLRTQTITRYYAKLGQKDFSKTVNSVLRDNVDLVFYAGMDGEASNLVKNLAARGYRGRFIMGDGGCTPEFTQRSGSAGNGSFCSLPGQPLALMAGADNFASNFNAQFGQIQLYAPYAYDATNFLAAAVEYAGSTERQKVVNVLKTTKFHGITQDIEFDGVGNLKHGVTAIYQVKGTSWEHVASIISP